ncbi:hypothetical protein LINPERHAP1_LOCUS37419 [Linum perenne]
MEEESSALCINDVLPHHLLTEVLIRISSIDLLRCKKVCKLWHSCLDNDPGFIREFVLHRVREREDKQLLHFTWSSTDMITLTPTWYYADASKFSLDFLPSFDDFIDDFPWSSRSLSDVVLGSSNGLLLCTSDRIFGARYWICNPVTKQWLELPPHSPRQPGKYNLDIKVGFISDSFYHVSDDDHSITVNNQFGVKVVRLDYSRYDYVENVREIDVETYTSETRCWTTYKVQLPDHVNGELEFDRNLGAMVPYNGRLYWLVQEGFEILVYDIDKNEFLMNRLDFPSSLFWYCYEHGVIVPFIGLSLCEASLWVAQAVDWQLRVYMLVDDDQWCLKHDVDILNGMQWGSDSVKLSKYMTEVDDDYFVFYSMHPSDPMIGYLASEYMLLECNFRSKTVRLIKDKNRYSRVFHVQPVYLPLWPTPLPLLPNA